MDLRSKMHDLYKCFRQDKHSDYLDTKKALAKLSSTNTDEDEQAIMSECIATIIALEKHHKKIREEKQQIINHAAISNALKTLSYSESKALLVILDELNERDEGIIIASQCADKCKLTRSVVVNSLRKLDSAEIICTKSLGMKGTYIKILNPEIRDIKKSL